jgi:hypothetical protein
VADRRCCRGVPGQPSGRRARGLLRGCRACAGGSGPAEPEDTTRENILAEAGYEQVYDIDEIITRMPTPEEINRLGISPGTPVAEHIRTGYTAEDRAVRVMVPIVPGDVLILQYTVPT